MHLDSLIRQKPGEKIIHVLRRDPITFVPRILMFLALVVLPVILYALLAPQFSGLDARVAWRAFSVIAASIYFLSVLLFFYASFIVFYLDISIVTDDRIIEVEQFGLFSRRTSEFDLVHVQDVTTDVHGLFASLFNYGNVIAKTASITADLIFYNVSNPNKIREDIVHLSELDKQKPHPETPQVSHHI